MAGRAGGSLHPARERQPRMTQTVVKPLKRKVLRDTVYDSLIDLLMNGELAPGTALSIDALAAQLGVSPTPVREALVHLERTGLVTRAALRGYRVAPPLSIDQIAQLCDARIVIEIGALDLAFNEIDELAIELTRLHAEHERTAAKIAGVRPTKAALAAYRRYLDADWAFHHEIFKFSRNEYLLDSSENLTAHLHQLRQSVTRGIHDTELAVAEHAKVLTAVQAHDKPAALAALREHLEQVKVRSLRGDAMADS